MSVRIRALSVFGYFPLHEVKEINHTNILARLMYIKYIFMCRKHMQNVSDLSSWYPNCIYRVI